MEPRYSISFTGLLAFLTILLLAVPTRAAFVESYCSSQNTGSGSGNDDQYQSNGACTDYCKSQGTFAFAIIQYRNCWCSSYIPQQQQNVNNCHTGCPGYPAENCGSKDDNLFIYIQLNGQPSGTAGGSKPTSASVSSAISSPSPTPTPSSSTDTSTNGKSTLATVPTSPQTSVQVVTESGAVVTRTVIQTPTSGTDSTSAPVKTGNGDDGPNIGAIVGGTVGGVLALVAIVGGLIFFLWRRRKQQRQANDDLNDSTPGSGSAGITRNTSTMSQSGLLGRGTGNVSQFPPQIATNFSTANSRYGDHDSSSPSSNRRNSQPLVIDSRLNPKAVLTFANTNASRDSLASLDDSQDYGRQLNVRNPDPS